MSKFLRLGLAAIALTFFFNAFAVTETKAQHLNEILKRMEAHRNTLSSLRANITMVKFNNQLGESDTYQGTTVYAPAKGRDALVRIDWTSPRKESLAVVNQQYVLYNAALKHAIVGKVNDAKGNAKANNALAFMNMSREQLRANYTVKYLGQENVRGGVATSRLELIPKVAGSYKSAELWVDKDGMPIQAKVTENNSDSTTILLSNLQKNGTIKASVFKIDLPKGTKVVEG
ncbi:MAG TPA: outer-membrane lipoprotein carrier protein LolA [Pyrinomonadaceae bacterium]|nr:outer-membrane lipoprotein carrier protein LolA [Pyrinomonadaceae bacterium]